MSTRHYHYATEVWIWSVELDLNQCVLSDMELQSIAFDLSATYTHLD